jgi:putative oxidoreductase
MKVGRLLLRASVGGFFIGHGTQKLFGWFNGHGLKNTSEAFEGMGMRPGRVHASAAGLAEAGGGAGLLLGYRTPLAGSALIATMLTAIERVHLKKGPWITEGGYEYNVVLLAAVAALTEAGPGVLSLDALRGRQRSGTHWMILALLLGGAGAAAAELLAQSQQRPEEPVGAAPASDAGAAAPQPAANVAAVAEPAADAAATQEMTAAQSGADAPADEPPASEATAAEQPASDEPAGEAPAEEPVASGD